MEKLSLKNKINVIRVELSKEMSKSGKNTYSKYDYFQLKDFMPKAIALMNEYGVYTEYQMVREQFPLPSKKTTQSQFDENGVKIGETITEEENFEYREVAILDVYNLDDEDDMIQLEKETSEVRLQAAQPIQNLGGRSTYMKRYLYMDLFEINENDKVEEETGKPVKVETKKPTIVQGATPTEKAQMNQHKTTYVGTVRSVPTEEKSEPVEVESENHIDGAAMMSMPRKVELATYIKEKGGVPKDVMAKVTTTLGLNTATLKESDYDSIKEEIDKELGGE